MHKSVKSVLFIIWTLSESQRERGGRGRWEREREREREVADV